MKNIHWRAMLTAALLSYHLMGTTSEPFVTSGAIDQPGVSHEQLLKWSSETLISIFTYDFQNASQTIENSRDSFSKYGFEQYQKNIKNSQWLPYIERKKYDVSPILDNNPTIVSEGPESGVYSWTVEVPLVLYLRGPYDMNKQKKMITLKIKRATLSDSSSGLLIEDFKDRENGEIN